jgi:hypothetical protein
MGITYNECDANIYKLIDDVMHKYHRSLSDQSVTIHAVFAEKYDGDGLQLPAIKFHGHDAAAKIQVTSLQDRARGLRDLKLTIDRYSWDRMTETRQIAMLDHELEHVEVKTDDDGIVVRDDLNRPKLRLKIHDWMLAGFASIIARHGEAAVEHREMVRWQEEWGQACLFPMVGTKAVAS